MRSERKPPTPKPFRFKRAAAQSMKAQPFLTLSVFVLVVNANKKNVLLVLSSSEHLPDTTVNEFCMQRFFNGNQLGISGPNHTADRQRTLREYHSNRRMETAHAEDAPNSIKAKICWFTLKPHGAVK